MKSISEYKNSALAALEGNWTPAVMGTLVTFVIVALFATSTGFMTRVEQAFYVFTSLPVFFIVVPACYGYVNAMRRLYVYGDNAVTENMAKFPLSHYMDVVWTMFYMAVKIILWTFVFVVPGFIKSFAYAMTPYILAEEPQLNAGEAIAKSARMMRGHKMELLLLELSFIGWFFLSVISMGIGFFWLTPYYNCAIAAFYEDVKAEFNARS